MDVNPIKLKAAKAGWCLKQRHVSVTLDSELGLVLLEPK